MSDFDTISTEKARAWIIAVVLVGVVLRLAGPVNELNHDEIYTWRKFASQGYATVVGDYSSPNNHILHSLLVRAAVQTFGQHDWSIRLPALLAGLGALPAFYFLCLALFGGRPLVPLVSTALLALSPVHIAYSRMARGYSLLVLLTILSLLFLLRALQGRPRALPGFVVFAFLASYTIPSGAIHSAILCLWALMVVRLLPGTTVSVRKLWGSFAVLGLIVSSVYWPLREGISQAGQVWGTPVWEQPGALFEAWAATAVRVAGGWTGLFVGAAACFGVYRLWLEERHVAAYLTGAWTAPVLLALAMGIMGQPRSYLFLLPGFLAAAGYGAAVVARKSTAGWRWPLMLVVIAGYGWAEASRLGGPEVRGVRESASHLERTPRENRLVVMPFIMDEVGYYYAGKAAREGLTLCLWHHRIDELLFLTNRADSRFGLAQYWMRRTDGKRSGLRLDAGDFTRVHSAGNVALNRYAGQGRRLFPAGDVRWVLDGGVPIQGLTVAPDGPAISDWPTIRIDGPAGIPVALRSSAAFGVPAVGLAVVAYAHSDPDARVTLFEMDEEVNEGAHARPLDMMRTNSIPMNVVDEDGRLWFVRADARPLAPGREYGLYLAGGGEATQLFAEVMCYFFPLRSQ